MKKYFWIGLIGLFLFEVANVYFIMPMPGSQEMNSIDLAYFLYKWRWVFRAVFVALLLFGLTRPHWKRRWLLILPMLLVGAVIYMANFKMAADKMFNSPRTLVMSAVSGNTVDTNRLVIGINYNGQAKAYPIRFLGYHHQVQDTINGKPVLVTYCTVCRTGRVFEPIVNGKEEHFRLVGMDHFNAMFEDAGTGSWWRQATGQAITGKLKGQQLPEFPSVQTSLAEWVRLNPATLIMQADPAYLSSYDSTLKYESGLSRSKLTGTDSIAWNRKAWVIGVKADNIEKAYDWNILKKDRIIHDKLGSKDIMLVLATDQKSFFALEEPGGSSFTLDGDTLRSGDHRFRIDGIGYDTSIALTRLPAYQEFWHSWKTFHPATLK